MITVWGRSTSSNVQAVMWTVAELGLAHERIDAGGAFGGLDTPEFRALNPNGRIPVVQDGEVTVWESAACVRYLAAAHGDAAFWPPEPGVRARLDKWAEWSKATWGAVVQNGLFWTLVRTPSAKRDPARIAALTDEARGLARILDARLAEGDWLGGAAFTFADVMAGHLLYRYYTLEIERAETPHLDAYYRRLTERPAFARHVMVSYDGLRVD